MWKKKIIIKNYCNSCRLKIPHTHTHTGTHLGFSLSDRPSGCLTLAVLLQALLANIDWLVCAETDECISTQLALPPKIY